MSTGYPLFPFPEPTFLWVHSFTILTNTGVTVNEAGDHARTETATVVRGYLAPPDRSEAERAERPDVRSDIVALVPDGTAVTNRDRISVDAGSGAPAWFIGTYEVTAVRPNPSHTRVLASRVGEGSGAHPV